MRNMKTDEAGHIVVKNLSAYWIPEIKVEREIHGTVYTVTGSFPAAMDDAFPAPSIFFCLAKRNKTAPCRGGRKDVNDYGDLSS